MGQSASKAASRLTSRISNAVQKQPQQSPSSSAAPRPDPMTGFTRGHGPKNPRDEQQRQFLQSQNPEGSSKDMPSDLLQFLNDAGPLKRNDDASSPSSNSSKRLPRIPGLDRDHDESSIPSEDSPSPHSDPTRTRQVMPLVSNLKQFGTERTTSFSNKADAVDSHDFGLDLLDIYKLLTIDVRNGTHQDAADDAVIVGEFYQTQLQGRESATTWTDSERQQHQLLLQQTRQYIEVPFLLKDDDDSYVGAFARDLPRLQGMKLEIMPESSVKLVLKDLIDSEEADAATTEHLAPMIESSTR